MKKLYWVLTVFASLLIINMPRSIPLQTTTSSAVRAEDVYGSHDLSIYPRPVNTTIASFQCGGNTLNILYQFGGSVQPVALADYQKTLVDALPKYQWVINSVDTSNENGQVVVATPNSMLADSGLKDLDISFASDGITIKLTKTGDYVSNECLFYWSKFYTN